MTLRSPSNISRHSQYKVTALRKQIIGVPVVNGAWNAAGDDHLREERIDAEQCLETNQRKEAKRILSRIMSDKQIIEQNLKDYKPFGDKWTKIHEETQVSQEYAMDEDPSSPLNRSESENSMVKRDQSPIRMAKL